MPENIYLADPDFYQPGPMDVLIGVKLFFKLMCVGQIALNHHPDVILQKTQLWWIVAGELSSTLSRKNDIQCHLIIHTTPLEANL